jgi:hypothetical protein
MDRFTRIVLGCHGCEPAVRCPFLEGEPAFPGSGISGESHVPIAVRDPTCILGVFRPT